MASSHVQPILTALKEPSRRDAPAVLYFPRPRRIRIAEGATINKEEFAYQWVWRYEDNDGFAGSLASYLVYLDYADPDEFAKTIDYLNRIDINGKRFSVARRQLQVLVTVPGGAQHPIDHLSAGEQSLLVFLLELRRRVTPGSIVLIDEVDDSLHPAFQYKLIYALQELQREFDLQLIVTSHSVDVLHAIGPEKTRILTDPRA